jgi:hypothetical protein
MEKQIWLASCFKASEIDKMNAAEILIDVYNGDVAERHGWNQPNEDQLIRCTELWLLNPRENFVRDLEAAGIKLTKSHQRDNQGKIY